MALGKILSHFSASVLLVASQASVNSYLLTINFRFIEGHSIFLSLLCFAFVLTALMMTYYKMENNRRDARDAERGLTADTYTLEMKLQQKEEGDNATFWRYTI